MKQTDSVTEKSFEKQQNVIENTQNNSPVNESIVWVSEEVFPSVDLPLTTCIWNRDAELEF